MLGRLLNGSLWNSERHWSPMDYNVGLPTTAGVNINPQESLTIPAVFCAVDLLASHMAMLPLPVYRRLSDDDLHRS